MAPHLAMCRWQVVHNDLNPHNVLVDAKNPDRIAGVLDFGDMVRTPLVCDLGVAASYQVEPAAALESLVGFTAAYHRVLPLTPLELSLVPDLTATRMLTTICITSWRAARYPENSAYILRNYPSARAGLLALAALTRAPLTTGMGGALGTVLVVGAGPAALAIAAELADHRSEIQVQRVGEFGHLHARGLGEEVEMDVDGAQLEGKRARIAVVEHDEIEDRRRLELAQIARAICDRAVAELESQAHRGIPVDRRLGEGIERAGQDELRALETPPQIEELFDHPAVDMEAPARLQ